MPFKAFVNGKLRAAWEFDDTEWKALRDEVKTGAASIFLPCCSAAGYPGRGFQRTSPKGTKHFYHAPDDQNPCTSKGESLAHLELKYRVMQICKDLGYPDTDIEVDFKDFRADVCCRVKSPLPRTIVFEIQLSPITYEELVRRNTLYTVNGIACIWLIKRFPPIPECTSILNRPHSNFHPTIPSNQHPPVEIFPPFKDPKYKMFAEDRIIALLIDPTSETVGYPKNESQMALPTFVDLALRFKVYDTFYHSITSRASNLVEFLYKHKSATLPDEIVYKSVQTRIDIQRKKIEDELVSAQIRNLEHHKELRRAQLFREADLELKEYEAKVRREIEAYRDREKRRLDLQSYEARLSLALQEKERQKIAMKFLLKSQFDVSVYGDPIDVFVGTSSGKAVKVYDKRMFD